MIEASDAANMTEKHMFKMIESIVAGGGEERDAELGLVATGDRGQGRGGARGDCGLAGVS